MAATNSSPPHNPGPPVTQKPQQNQPPIQKQQQTTPTTPYVNQDPRLEQLKIVKAERCQTKGPNPQPTLKVLVVWKGPLPKSLNLGMWGSIPTMDYTPQPLRCFNCQRSLPGHSQTTRPQQTTAAPTTQQGSRSYATAARGPQQAPKNSHTPSISHSPMLRPIKPQNQPQKKEIKIHAKPHPDQHTPKKQITNPRRKISFSEPAMPTNTYVLTFPVPKTRPILLAPNPKASSTVPGSPKPYNPLSPPPPPPQINRYEVHPELKHNKIFCPDPRSLKSPSANAIQVAELTGSNFLEDIAKKWLTSA
ncbi:uncharacterized protein LOC135208388 [Macrobrachium nipponense]|uniref:uncharacterized protein LOC135208388 n=1 Tax=Macrobrachium nipponense TaxID=159736 RepID=UPI0030C81FB5